MSAARAFSKTSPAVWRSERFRRLSDKAKVGFFYFISNPHLTSAGLYELPVGYALSDLDWTAEVYAGVCAELLAAEMIDFDGEIVCVERWFRHNPPMNDDHAAGTRRIICRIESDRLRQKALASFEHHNSERIEREAAKASEKQAKLNGKARTVAELVGRSSHLADTPFMRRARA